MKQEFLKINFNFICIYIHRYIEKIIYAARYFICIYIYDKWRGRWRTKRKMTEDRKEIEKHTIFIFFDLKAQRTEIFHKIIHNNGESVMYANMLITLSINVKTRGQIMKSNIFLLMCARLNTSDGFVYIVC